MGNTYYDYFKNRIIFPIFNEKWIIGFIGRTLEKNEYNKYLNSKNSIIFNKKNILYNLWNVKNIIKKDDLIIVEGIFDVLSFVEIGIKNVISTLGINISKYQLNEIQKISNNIVLGFDNDVAGISSALEKAYFFVSNGFNVKIINYGNYKDANDVLINMGAKKLNNIYNSKTSYTEFLVNNYLNNDKINIDDDIKLVKILRIISIDKNIARKNINLNKLSKLSKINLRQLFLILEQNNISFSNEKNDELKYKSSIIHDINEYNLSNINQNESKILYFLIKHQNMYKKIIAWFSPINITYRKIFIFIVNKLVLNEKVKPRDIDTFIKNNKLNKIDIKNLIKWKSIDNVLKYTSSLFILKNEYQNCLFTIKRHDLQKKIHLIKNNENKRIWSKRINSLKYGKEN